MMVQMNDLSPGPLPTADLAGWKPVSVPDNAYSKTFDMSFKTRKVDSSCADHSNNSSNGENSECNTRSGIHENSLKKVPVHILVEEKNDGTMEDSDSLNALLSQVRSEKYSPAWSTTSYGFDPGLKASGTLRRKIVNKASPIRIMFRKRLLLESDPTGGLRVTMSCSTSIRRNAFIQRSISEFRDSMILPDIRGFYSRIGWIQGIYQPLLESVSDPRAIRILIVLHICHALLVHEMDNLSRLKKAYDDQLETLLDLSSNNVLSSLAGEIARVADFYDDVERSCRHISSTTAHLLDMLTPFFPPTHSFHLLSPEIRALCADIGATGESLSARLEKRLRYVELRRNVEEAESLKRLTIFAGIFLPLSLACSFLSMQTRFADLHYLIYDFCGVVVILIGLAVLVLLALRFISIAPKLIVRFEARVWKVHKGVWPIAAVMGAAGILIAWALLAASFLVGMIKDVTLGLKILGYGVAAYFAMSLVACFALAFIVWEY
ncbi:hypothetical protein BDV96DRAFT_638649 [Lophiotrema nucula]|uniref:Uncharacterized protein n=1 Tax=Lophiotrema nucula TaxID=690887 RepID=A0A6A5YFR1_9PLEO|nr:hypothetical protein BDV96DRAFT_638649 [Lophiotrema nucula]